MGSFAAGLRLVLLFLLWASGTGWSQQNPIQAENAKPGTSAWRLTVLADQPTVEGYASHTSVGRGETIRFFVSSAAPTYTLAIYRMGWYGGAGGRQLLSVSLPGQKQPVPAPDPVTGLIECNWPESYRVTIPQTDWTSGIYLAKLTPSSGSESYIIFVVRDDSSAATYVYQSTATTSQAYNNWGGKSLYGYNSTNSEPARKVSFNRPYARSDWAGTGAGNFFSWEVYFLHFLEREGYDVTYVSNLDLHTRGSLLLSYKAFLVAGHDEYWSYPMKSAVHAARAQGVHLGFFTANQSYWQIRFEPSATGQPDRTIVGYKEASEFMDPLALDGDRSNDKFITARFRDLQPIFGVVDSVAEPENGLVGVMYHGDPFDGDIIVSDAANWVYEGTGVSNGSRFTGLLGYETDTIVDNGYSPPQLQKIAESPDPWGFAHVTTYTTSSGSTVFATGSIQWSWGLDNHGWLNLESDAVKHATRNVLARFASGAALAPPSNVQATGGVDRIDLAWTAPAGATSFNLYRGLASGAEGNTAYRTGIASASFSDTGLAAGTYYYQVTALNGSTESARSAEVSATATGSTPPPPPPPPPPDGAPLAPSALRVSLAGNNVKLAWTQSTSAGIIGNNVYRATSGTGPFTRIATLSPSTSYVDNGTAKKTTYYYVVTAISSGGESAYSNTVSQRTR